ncbi:MAG TPA: hypothetical protein VG406_17040 [Isosphaeraceae bacterium]|jgi:hypothetical protein|nr:hypothetical protein [Isosphaeraceae bacterium]
MLHQPGRVPAVSTAEGPAPLQRRIGRRPLDLEVLEPRLLLAGRVDGRWTPGPPAVVVGLPPAADGGDDGLEYDAGPPAPGPYIVVPETPAFHGSIATAQPLPDVPFAGVAGAVGAAGTMDVYRVPPGSGTLTLRLAPTAAGAAVGLRLTLFDAHGRVLDDLAAAAGPIDVALDLRRLGDEGLPVFVAVSPAGAVDAPAAGYQLWVLRQSAVPPPPVDMVPTTSPLSGPLAVVPLTTSAGAWGSLAGLEVGPGAAAVAPGGLGVGPVPVAPTLLAAPAGGLLAEGAPAVRAAGSGVDGGLDLGDAPARPSASGSADLGDEFDAIRRPVTTATLIAVRDPGGAPLLGAGPIGDWRGATAVAPSSCHPSGPSRPIATIAAVALPAAVATHVRPTPGRASRPRFGAGLRPVAALTVYVLGVDRAMLLDLPGRRPDPDPRPGRRRRPAL